jgi:predicted acetyltransferase
VTTPFEVAAPASDTERSRFRDILCECFCSPPERMQQSMERVGRDDVLLVRRGGEVLGGLFLLPFGQWFGGKRVPTIGIAAVGIAPEHRGTGAARALMLAALRETQRRKVPLSTLYPATHTVYRSAGYELAGSYHTITVDTWGIPFRDRTLTMRSGSAADLPIMQELYQRVAPDQPGWLDRSALIWQRRVDPWEKPPRIQLVFDGDEPVGYCCFLTEKHDSHHQTMRISDLVAATPAAARRLLTFIADHRSLVKTAIWNGPANDPLLMCLPERCYRIHVEVDWMLRIVDVVSSFSQRGYPRGLSAEVHLEVTDPDLTDNGGRFVLTVEAGTGRVEPGGEGHLRCTARGLAALYTGFMTPLQLHACGLLDSTAEHLRASAAVFAGSPPTMVDIF